MENIAGLRIFDQFPKLEKYIKHFEEIPEMQEFIKTHNISHIYYSSMAEVKVVDCVRLPQITSHYLLDVVNRVIKINWIINTLCIISEYSCNSTLQRHRRHSNKHL